MCAELMSRGWSVTSIDLLPTPLAPNNALMHLVGDVHYIVPTLLNTRYDLIVHCAYHVGGRSAIDGRNLNLIRNVALDAMMFEWAIRTEQPRFLYWSSSAVYPVSLQTTYAAGKTLREANQRVTDRRATVVGVPDARYGWAKLNGEHLAQVATENGLNVHIVRPFSGYGHDQSQDYPFPSFMRRASLNTDEPFVIWGSKLQTRDWIHVSDVVRGALAVVDAGVTEPVNLCTGQATSMGDLATMMMRALTGRTRELAVDETAPMGVMHRVGDPALFYRIYQPTMTIEDGIQDAKEKMIR